jgi:hypothetical protein
MFVQLGIADTENSSKALAMASTSQQVRSSHTIQILAFLHLSRFLHSYTEPFHDLISFSSVSCADKLVVAVNSQVYKKGASCGACYRVRCKGSKYLSGACTGKTVDVRVTDK